MGNHGSRKDQAKCGKHGGKAAHTLSKVEELRGPPVDSYDKLIAWLAEMAESDNVELDTSVFVSQLNRVCRGRTHNSFLDVPADGGRGSTGESRGADNALGGISGKRAPNTRQNSTSCDSHVSSDVTQRNRSSTRSDDYLDPSSAWRSGVSTRQNTFSDDLEEEEDSDLRNASMESLYSSTDRDSELGSILAYDGNCRRGARKCSFQNSSPLLRDTFAKRLICVDGINLTTPCSASTGNLELTDDTGRRRLPNHYAKKSASLLDLSKPEIIVPRKSVPKLVVPHSNDLICGLKPPTENITVRKKLGSGPKSLSVTSGRNRQAQFVRQFSLHSEPRLFASGGVLKPIFPARTVNLEPPSKSKAKSDAAAAFLNDTLLDRNIADILFSVEALWPRK